MTTWTAVAATANSLVIASLGQRLFVAAGVVPTLPWKTIAAVVLICSPVLYVLGVRVLARRTTRDYAEQLADAEAEPETETTNTEA